MSDVNFLTLSFSTFLPPLGQVCRKKGLIPQHLARVPDAMLLCICTFVPQCYFARADRSHKKNLQDSAKSKTASSTSTMVSCISIVAKMVFKHYIHSSIIQQNNVVETPSSSRDCSYNKFIRFFYTFLF